MAQEETIQNTEQTEFNAGLATAQAVRELFNHAAVARMSKHYINDESGFGYCEFLESVYLELRPFMDEDELKESQYCKMLLIWQKIANHKYISFEDLQDLKHFEDELRGVAKERGLLMPKQKNARWTGSTK